MKRAVSFVILLLTVCPCVVSQVWTLEGPSSRHSHSAVYDPTSAQMIIFGGQQTTTNLDLNDTWLGVTSTTQNESFTQMFPTGTAPQGRFGHVATYDSISNRMTLFGGGLGNPGPCANDVWILDGANGKNGAPVWIAESPAGNLPAARLYAGGAYDPNSNSLIVFGGSNCASGYFNDVWVLSSANGNNGTPTWTQLATVGIAPAPRESASVIYDPVNNSLTLYGGDAGGAPFGDAWVLSNANGNGGTPTWTQLSPSGTAPLNRTGQSAVYDSVNNRMIIFGGANKSQTLVDSWVLTAANGNGVPSWVQLKPTGTSPSVSYHSAVYSQTLNQMFIFAGSSSTNKLQTNSHAFTLMNANGLKTPVKWTLGGPAVRYGQSAFYDNVTGNLFVWGGQHSKSNLDFNDYWQASGVIGSSNLNWKLLATKNGTPTPRFGHTGLYDSSSNRLMIFGGSATTAGTCQNDYHVLQHANNQGGSPSWIAITAAGTAPSPRALQASAYDPSTNTIMLFGGWDCGLTYFNDLWLLSNANDISGLPTWTQVVPAGVPPSPRESSTAIYDPNSNSLIVYGGDAGKVIFGDLWILSNANGTGGTPTWTQVTPLNNGPAARSGQTAIYDSVNNIMTIYAGFDGVHVLSDVWMLSGANGQSGAPSWTAGVSGQPRREHSSIYEPVSNTMITFGGSSSNNPLVPSADIYSLTDANGLRPK